MSTRIRCGRCNQAIDQLERQLLCLNCQRDLLQAYRDQVVGPRPGFMTVIVDPNADSDRIELRRGPDRVEYGPEEPLRFDADGIMGGGIVWQG